MATKYKYSIVLFLILFLLIGCKEEKKSSDTDNKYKFKKEGQIVIITSINDSLSFDIEIADTPYKTALGLMYRNKMAQNESMFFIFEYQRIQNFWMKNTYIPLDILFIDDEFTIVSIFENCMPFSTETIASDMPALYALEINAGLCRKLGVEIGQRVIYKDFR